MSRQIPHVEDLATGTPTAGHVPVSAGPGLPPAWGAGSGGGSSGDGVWTQIDQKVAVGGEDSLDFTSVPNTYDTLVAVGDYIHTTTDPGAGGELLSVEFNEWDGNDYIGQEHYVRSIGLGVQHGTQGLGSQAFGVCHGSLEATGGDGASFVAWFPGYASTAARKPVHSQGVQSYGNGYVTTISQGFARMNLARAVPIDHLKFFFGSWSGSPTRLFAAGSRVTLYGLKNGSSSGGGGGSSLQEFHLVRTSNQVVTPGLLLGVGFDTELRDTDGFHSTSTNTDRITIPSGLAGEYEGVASLQVVYGASSVGRVTAEVILTRDPDPDGWGTYYLGDAYIVDGAASKTYVLNIPWRWALIDGDYLQLSVHNATGANITLQSPGVAYDRRYPRIWGRRLGAS